MKEVHAQPSAALDTLAVCCAVGYTILYNVGMIIQCIANHKRKSTKGYSTDYAVIAYAGFFCLLVN